MKKIIMTTLVLLYIVMQVRSQSLTQEKDETIFIKSKKSRVYKGVDTLIYQYSVYRTHASNGLVESRITVDTTKNDTIMKEYYEYSIDKIKLYKRYRKSRGTLQYLYNYEITYDANNIRTAYKSIDYREEFTFNGTTYYNQTLIFEDNYAKRNGIISAVNVDITSDGNSSLYILDNSNSRGLINWSDYYNEKMKTYIIDHTDSTGRTIASNTVFFNYKDEYGSYDQTERSLVSYERNEWKGIHRSTRNFDANGLNSITEADSTDSGWQVKSKVSYWYDENNNLATVTTAKKTNGVTTYLEHEVFDNMIFYRLRRVDVAGMFRLDARDLTTVSGIDNVDMTNISMYPNPATDRINIIGLSSNFKTVNIINCQGVIAYTTYTNQSNVVIDYPLNSGLYIVQVTEENKTIRLSNLIIQ